MISKTTSRHVTPRARRLATLRTAGFAAVAALILLAGPFAHPAAAQTCTSPGAIGGIVFLDANGNGTRQAEEDGINGVVLRVTGPTGSTLLVTTSGVGLDSGRVQHRGDTL